ncbi:hypothetical protein DRF65_08385 [Chryseobacterium pennae]|uniref:Uncharacterized protein n=1 Tax=Chryseobacterium pennae TaxID=2258962 RepID=A0A3D9CAC8_9FLAO|nr:hypothetical protein DRF65_08385 [Chryseobacterium pennae]
MKPLIIFLFLLVSILSFAQRKPKDTLGVSDCTEFYKEGLSVHKGISPITNSNRNLYVYKI